jgi:hypothetical protein
VARSTCSQTAAAVRKFKSIRNKNNLRARFGA